MKALRFLVGYTHEALSQHHSNKITLLVSDCIPTVKAVNLTAIVIVIRTSAISLEAASSVGSASARLFWCC